LAAPWQVLSHCGVRVVDLRLFVPTQDATDLLCDAGGSSWCSWANTSRIYSALNAGISPAVNPSPGSKPQCQQRKRHVMAPADPAAHLAAARAYIALTGLHISSMLCRWPCACTTAPGRGMFEQGHATDVETIPIPLAIKAEFPRSPRTIIGIERHARWRVAYKPRQAAEFRGKSKFSRGRLTGQRNEC
jgi:hypothetical protein